MMILRTGTPLICPDFPEALGRTLPTVVYEKKCTLPASKVEQNQ